MSDEDFLILDDEETSSSSSNSRSLMTSSESKQSKSILSLKNRLSKTISEMASAIRKKKSNENTEQDYEIVDTVLAVDGIQKFEWQLRGMDCPDCAMKATRAVNRLPGVNNVIVSATEEV